MHNLAEFYVVDGDKIWVLYEFDDGAKLLEFKTHILNHAPRTNLGRVLTNLVRKLIIYLLLLALTVGLHN